MHGGCEGVLGTSGVASFLVICERKKGGRGCCYPYTQGGGCWGYSQHTRVGGCFVRTCACTAVCVCVHACVCVLCVCEKEVAVRQATCVCVCVCVCVKGGLMWSGRVQRGWSTLWEMLPPMHVFVRRACVRACVLDETGSHYLTHAKPLECYHCSARVRALFSLSLSLNVLDNGMFFGEGVPPPPHPPPPALSHTHTHHTGYNVFGDGMFFGEGLLKGALVEQASVRVYVCVCVVE